MVLTFTDSYKGRECEGQARKTT